MGELISWKLLLYEYLTEDVSYFTLSKRHNVKLSTIEYHAKRNKWVEQKKIYRGKVVDAIKRQAIEILVQRFHQTGEIPEPKPEVDRSKPLVYVLGNEEFGLYKIGYSGSPVNYKKRKIALAVSCPFVFNFELIIDAPNGMKFESELHKRYGDKRSKGEWFRLTEDDLQYLIGLNNKSYQLTSEPRLFVG